MSATATLALSQVPAPVVTTPDVSWMTTFLFGLFLVALGLWILPLARRVVGALVPAPEPARARWNLLHVGIVGLTYVSAAILLLAFVRPPADDTVLVLALSAAIFGAGVVVAVAFAAATGLEGLHAFGIRAHGNVRAVAAGVATYVICLPGYAGSILLWAVCLQLAGRDMRPQEVLHGISQLSPDERVVPLLLGALLQPLFEEALFRGFLQPVLVQWLRPAAGIVLTSILFAGMHGLDPFGPIFVLSLILGWIQHRTQRLSAAWAVHALHNGAQFAILFAYPEFGGATSAPGG